jgi:hypothetical protein
VLPDDFCVTPDNEFDPNYICSTAAPVCDAGYSGKCIKFSQEGGDISGPCEYLAGAGKGEGGAVGAGCAATRPWARMHAALAHTARCTCAPTATPARPRDTALDTALQHTPHQQR